MNRILFTRKHVIASIAIGILVLLTVIGTWLLLIAPIRLRVEASNRELKNYQTEIISAEENLAILKQNPTLFESDVIKVTPNIPNGISLETYFQELKAISSSLGVSIQSIRFEHELIYPEGATTEKQLRKSEIGFDVIGSSARDIISFVDQLEQGNRFIKVQNITYRANESVSSDADYSYSATVVIETYYLSDFETGKAIEEQMNK